MPLLFKILRFFGTIFDVLEVSFFVLYKLLLYSFALLSQLTFLAKFEFVPFQEVGAKRIMNQEHKFVEAAYTKWDPIPNLFILGQSIAERLPIFAVIVKHPETQRLIHHNFVSALLNDLFGVQARGGCACAGPYAEVR